MGNAQLNLMNILFNPRYVYIVGHALDCGLYIYFTRSKTKIRGSLKLQTVTTVRLQYVTVLGHSPLSRPVAWRRLSSPIGLGYRRHASTHLLNALQMVAPRAAI